MQSSLQKKKNSFRQKIRNQQYDIWKKSIRQKSLSFNSSQDQTDAKSVPNRRSNPRQLSYKKQYAYNIIKKVSGDQCFYDLDTLKCAIQFTLMNKDYELMKISDNQTNNSKEIENNTKINRQFYMGCYFICQIQKWEKLQTELLDLLCIDYCEWFRDAFLIGLEQSNSLQYFMSYIKQFLLPYDIQIQGTVLDKLYQITRLPKVDQLQKVMNINQQLKSIFTYFSKKMEILRIISQQLQKKYATSLGQNKFNWKQWIYNCQLHEGLVQIYRNMFWFDNSKNFQQLIDQNIDLMNKIFQFTLVYLTYFYSYLQEYQQSSERIQNQIIFISIQLIDTSINNYVNNTEFNLSRLIIQNKDKSKIKQKTQQFFLMIIKILDYFMSTLQKQLPECFYTKMIDNWTNTLKIVNRYVFVTDNPQQFSSINQIFLQIDSKNLSIFINFYQNFDRFIDQLMPLNFIYFKNSLVRFQSAEKRSQAMRKTMQQINNSDEYLENDQIKYAQICNKYVKYDTIKKQWLFNKFISIIKNIQLSQGLRLDIECFQLIQEILKLQKICIPQIALFQGEQINTDRVINKKIQFVEQEELVTFGKQNRFNLNPQMMSNFHINN